MPLVVARRRQQEAVGEGFEPISGDPTSYRSLRQSPIQNEAESEAVWPNSSPIDADLAAVVDAWPKLPEAIKAGILAMVRAAQ